MRDHDPISQDQRELMNYIAQDLDHTFNPMGERKIGFALLVWTFGEDIEGTGRINYIGNGKRDDVRVALKELLARWEGRYQETTGGPQS